MALKTVYYANDLIEAALIISILNAHNIDAQHFDQHINTLYFGAQVFAPIRILVNEEDFCTALELLNEHFITQD